MISYCLPMSKMPGKKKKYNARFPPARIKKIMQTDEEVGKVASAVPVIISRVLELFAESLLTQANEITMKRGARTLTPSHLKFCIENESKFDFLREMVANVPDLQDDELEMEGEVLPPVQQQSKPRAARLSSMNGNQDSSFKEPHTISKDENDTTGSSYSSPDSSRGGVIPTKRSKDVTSTFTGNTTTTSKITSSSPSVMRGTGQVKRRGRPPKTNGSVGRGGLPSAGGGGPLPNPLGGHPPGLDNRLAPDHYQDTFSLHHKKPSGNSEMPQSIKSRSPQYIDLNKQRSRPLNLSERLFKDGSSLPSSPLESKITTLDEFSPRKISKETAFSHSSQVTNMKQNWSNTSSLSRSISSPATGFVLSVPPHHDSSLTVSQSINNQSFTINVTAPATVLPAAAKTSGHLTSSDVTMKPTTLISRDNQVRPGATSSSPASDVNPGVKRAHKDNSISKRLNTNSSDIRLYPRPNSKLPWANNAAGGSGYEATNAVTGLDLSKPSSSSQSVAIDLSSTSGTESLDTKETWTVNADQNLGTSRSATFGRFISLDEDYDC